MRARHRGAPGGLGRLGRLGAPGLVLALAVGGFGAGGCAGTESSAAPPASTTTSSDGTVVVTIVDHDLHDPEIEVPVGGSVRWENHDTGEHELVALTGDVIRSPVLGQAASYTARFEAPGEYPYYCNIHNYMKGTVVVR